MAEYRFNAPPGWPTPPSDWRPAEGWKPDPLWPAAPQGWSFWVEVQPPLPQLPPQPSPTAFQTQSEPSLRDRLANRPQRTNQGLATPELPAVQPPFIAQSSPTSRIIDQRLARSLAYQLAVSEAQQISLLVDDKRLLTQALRDEINGRVANITQRFDDVQNEVKAAYEQDIQRYAQLTAVSQHDTLEAENAINERAAAQRLQSLQAAERQLTAQIRAAEANLIDTQARQGLEEVSLYHYYNPAENSYELKAKLDDVNSQIKRMIQDKGAILANAGFTFNNSAAEGRKFVRDFSTLMLTAYNQEAENAIVKAERGRDIDAALNRIDRAADKIRKLGTMLGMSVNPTYHGLRRKEIELSFQYKNKLEIEREAERERKAEMREEEKANREAAKKNEELAAAKRAIDKQIEDYKAMVAEKLRHEGTQLANAISFLPENDPQLQALLARQAEIQKEKDVNDEVIANTRAGYVYVISNIGAFGEGMVKIGLTRRATPEERIKELGSASVPFHFDTHVLHYSSDAVGLETALHHRFAAQAVNKINSRKEFFRVHPREVRDAMMQISNGAVLSFEVEPEAADYRASQKL